MKEKKIIAFAVIILLVITTALIIKKMAATEKINVKKGCIHEGSDTKNGGYGQSYS